MKNSYVQEKGGLNEKFVAVKLDILSEKNSTVQNVHKFILVFTKIPFTTPIYRLTKV